MTDREALEKAKRELSRASAYSDIGSNNGIRTIYSNRADWLCRVIWLAENELERREKKNG